MNNINVVIDKSHLCNPLLSNKSAFISFNFNQELVDYLKTLKYYKYEPKTHTWEIQEKDLLQFCNIFGNKGFQIKIIDIYKEPKCINTLKDLIPKDYHFYLDLKKYQREGVNYGLNNDKFLLADEPGLGKTAQSLYATDIKCKTGKILVIVCSKILRYNWKNEILKTLNQEAYILGKNGKGGGKDKLYDLEHIDDIKQKYIVTNIHTLSLLKSRRGKSKVFDYPIAKKINELSQLGKIEAIIIDEFHLGFKNITSASSKALLRIPDTKYKIAMTGTPVVNTPLDVYVILRWLGILNKDIDYYKFKDTFAILDGWGNVLQYKNIDKLSDMLRNKMLRREQKDNLDIPPKNIIDEVLEMSPKQERLYKTYAKDYKKHIIAKLKADDSEGTLIELRKITNFPHLIDDKLDIEDSVKLIRLKELLEQITSNGHKAIVYSNWTTTTNILKEELKQYNPAYITGEVNDKNRQLEQDRFMQDNNCKVLIGTMGAMGVGLTLTSANYVIFYDEPWNQATYDQACDRVYRIGQNNKVTIYNLLCKGTIDEGVHNLIRGKGAFAKYMVDGTISESIDNKELLEALIGDTEDDSINEDEFNEDAYNDNELE